MVWSLLDECPTSANLGNDHGFIIKEYYLHWGETFWEAQSKAMRAYAQSGQYHTTVERRVRLKWYQSHALNLAMSIESSNVEQRTPKEKGNEKELRGGVGWKSHPTNLGNDHGSIGVNSKWTWMKVPLGEFRERSGSIEVNSKWTISS